MRKRLIWCVAAIVALVLAASAVPVVASDNGRVSFTVQPTSPLAAAWLQVRELVGRTAPWSWLVAVALLTLAALAALRRRFRISIARRS